MPEPETKVRAFLNELAGEIRLDPRLERATLRRARRRRIGTAALSLAVVVGLATGGLLAVRQLSPRVTPGGDAIPSPSAEPSFAGLWPESDPLSLAAAQAQVDLGHEPWRVDPEQTASAFATNLMGWQFDQVRTNVQDEEDAFAVVSVSNTSFGPAVPDMFVGLRQLGMTGPDGIWSVVRASSPLIRLDEVPTTAVLGSTIPISGRLTDLFDGASLRVDFLDGSTLESGVAGGGVALKGDRFEASWPVPSQTTDGRLMVLVHVVDATETDLGTVAFPLTVEGAFDQHTAPPPALPEAVARTRKAIMDAASHGDINALAAHRSRPVHQPPRRRQPDRGLEGGPTRPRQVRETAVHAVRDSTSRRLRRLRVAVLHTKGPLDAHSGRAQAARHHRDPAEGRGHDDRVRGIHGPAARDRCGRHLALLRQRRLQLTNDRAG